MTREQWIVGLDIGTTKVCTVVAQTDGDHHLTIAGIGLAPSKGIKKGVVVDVEDTVTAIRNSLERARHMAGVEFDSVVVGVTGDHIASSNQSGSVSVTAPDRIVRQEDVDRALQAALLDVPRHQEIIHSIIRGFAVDGHRGIRRPIGMSGQRLEVETHVVTGGSSFLQNVSRCVESSGLRVSSMVLEPIATSEAVTTADERELGVALIDIGGGTSDIAVFSGGSITHSAVLPVGGNQVTRDISIGLRTSLEAAERLKIERGLATTELVPPGEALEVVMAGSGARLRLPLAVLCEIIEARMTELFEMSQAAIIAAGSEVQPPAGIVLTGGGALLPGALDLARKIFDLPVRLGKPLEVGGWSEQVNAPQFATSVGLIRYAARQQAEATDGVYRPGASAPEPATTEATPSPESDSEEREQLAADAGPWQRFMGWLRELFAFETPHE